jgi:hypothetical protein
VAAAAAAEEEEEEEEEEIEKEEIEGEETEEDLNGRVRMMSRDGVESRLRARRMRDGPDVSLWDYLNNPGGGVLPIQAAGEVMSAAADTAEDVSVDAAYVWRWVQLNSLWNTHPDPDMRSEMAFFSSFGNGNIIRIMIVIGTSVQLTKRAHHAWIEKHWGEAWYDQIPPSIRPVRSGGELSRRVTTQIAITCASVPDVTEAVVGWKAAVEKRLDPTRRRPGTRQKKTPTLTLDDLTSYNESIGACVTGLRRDAPDPAPSSLTITSASSTFTGANKRKRALQDEPAVVMERPPPPSPIERDGSDGADDVGDDDDNDDDDDDKEDNDDGGGRDDNGKDGKDGDGDNDDDGDDVVRVGPSAVLPEGSTGWRVKKVRKHLVWEPMTPPCASPAAGPSERVLDIPSSGLDDASSQACDGPEFARMFARFTEIHAHFEDNGHSADQLVRNCCDSCCDYVRRALACLKAHLEPSVAGLERVRIHNWREKRVEAMTECPVEPRGEPRSRGKELVRVRPRRVVPDSSGDEDEDEVD